MISNARKSAIDEFHVFNSHTIAGRIIYLFSSVGGDRFRLDHSDQQYTFNSITHRDGTIFTAKADLGDSIYKKAFSDTLYLIKKDSTRYQFTFIKQE
jgi:hypothetical protein